MEEQAYPTAADYVADYLQGVLGDRTAGVTTPDGQPVPTLGAGHLAPTFLADAPWRLEPEVEEIPCTFVIRDAESDDVKMRLTEIAVWEAPDDGLPWQDKAWQLVHRFADGLGEIPKKFWTYRPSPSEPLGPPPTIPLTAFRTAVRGERLLLKVVFRGSRLKPIVGRRHFEVWKPLVILVASGSISAIAVRTVSTSSSVIQTCVTARKVRGPRFGSRIPRAFKAVANPAPSSGHSSVSEK